jgi:hypothetical protein
MLARVSARFSKSFASRRFRSNREKVRSTTQRGGRTTKPFVSSLRMTISMRSGGTFATAASTYQALQPPSAQISSSHRKRRRILSRAAPAPSRSWIAAE